MSDEPQQAWPAPRENPDLIGHEEAEASLAAAVASGRLAHGWLITGPRGIGKATLAFRFARYLLANRGAEAEAPGLFGAAETAAPAGLRTDPNLPVFRRIASGGHADLITVERSWDEKKKKRRGEIVIGDVRDIGQFLHLTPAEGGWRVVVVDCAEDMNRNAANAVLKVLEEPPRRSVLLLVSHAPGRLLPTIRSRCRRLALKPLADAQVRALLARYRPGLEPADQALLVWLAQGSIGRALALAEEEGLELYHELGEQLGRLPDLDIPAVHDFADRLARDREGDRFRTAADLLEGWMARLLRTASLGRPDPGIPPEEAQILGRLAGSRGLDQWLALWEKVTRLIAGAEQADLDLKQVWIGAMLALAGQGRR
ncbi:DNA polymerase III subunit delta' [Hypericibacter terrae]|uniref:DNA polymerase III subunit delta n=1 Tax=Hypericibacter terrae TaxID=2602015 RepID=A0A5J6MIQ3_9PROT|nr:DNA polymerase III subunit delta' [Hypericibacter terrae]QEX17249.1 DNA polymerase III subunit delta' [Hypericibacter terrae]